jgi:hypothetical protein
VFVTPWWHKTWWDNFGGSSSGGFQTRPCILSVYDGDDLLGIAPLMSDGDRLTFLGDKDLSDYFDFVVPQDRVDRFFRRCGNICRLLTGRRLIFRRFPTGRRRLNISRVSQRTWA